MGSRMGTGHRPAPLSTWAGRYNAASQTESGRLGLSKGNTRLSRLPADDLQPFVPQARLRPHPVTLLGPPRAASVARRATCGAGTGNRTPDLFITSESLCRLSYPGVTVRTRHTSHPTDQLPPASTSAAEDSGSVAVIRLALIPPRRPPASPAPTSGPTPTPSGPPTPARTPARPGRTAAPHRN